jgi:Tfp pilus assembly protein PilN
MTTAVLPPPESMASPERLFRPVPISADLLPVEIIESRRGRRVRRAVIAGLVAFALLLTTWYGQTAYHTGSARHTLTRAEQTAEDLQRQQRQDKTFAEVVAAQGESKRITGQLNTLFAKDVPWSAMLDALQDAAPPSVRITNIKADVATKEGGEKETKLPSTTTEAAVGEVVITGIAPSKPAIAAYVDALAGVPGVANALVNSVNVDGAQLNFSLTVDITDSALGGRFTAKDDNTSGGK